MNIKLTVEVDGNKIERAFGSVEMYTNETWGDCVLDMLDTIEKSNDKKF